MPFILAGAALAAHLTFASVDFPPVGACAPRPAAEALLGRSSMTPKILGVMRIAAGSAMMELWESPEGWVMTATSQTGVTCVVRSGLSA